ncbi:hypothetical protein CUMW_094420 [Citrus unshiu]|uniref:Uncharacterized protein n=1 Tax=Citrus unshiu TaxID=55188 RepID=A0A2H5P156_CITUN|nr:hypothetical protein CUMW_094420 [Citrus unshiu]
MATSCHTRSNSFPTRSHPQILEVEEHLRRLRSSQAASTSSLGHELNGLQDLHDSVEKILQLPLVQQALARGHQKKWVDELLNGSFKILDVCSTAQNALLQMKESALGLQSVLRRRRGDETELTSEIKKYLASRKAMRKAINKTLGNLKGVENECSPSINEEHVGVLKEVEAVTLATFEYLLSFISGSRTPSKLSRFALVTKLIRPKRIACQEDQTEMNEFEKVDAALSTVVGHKTIKSDNIIYMQNQLKEMESSIQDLEEGLESLSRRLIKARVPLLNILTN